MTVDFLIPKLKALFWWALDDNLGGRAKFLVRRPELSDNHHV
jgi:hypothetical protein